jgi:hypothetical protein
MASGTFWFCWLLGFMLATVIPLSALAQGPPGSKFLQACGAAVKQQDGLNVSDDEMFAALWCIGYVQGFVDAVSVTQTLVRSGRSLCFPQQGVSNDQAIRVFVKYLRENPQVLHESGRTSLVISLAQTFPCK